MRDVRWIAQAWDAATGARGMAIAAFVVSLLSVRHAARSAQDSRRSADAAIAADHRARQPNIQASIVELLAMGPGLRIVNGGPTDLDALAVEVVTTAGERPPHNVTGLYLFSSLSAPGGPVVDIGPLGINDSRDLVPSVHGGFRGGILRLRCYCESADERWVVPVDVELPNLPRP
jgi:hypothetical protein